MDREVAHPLGGPGELRRTGPEHGSAAVGALFREHHLEFVRLALVMTGDLGTAEDVVQDTFERLHRRWPGLSDRGDGLRGYARAAVLNRCRSVHRRAAVARRQMAVLAGSAVLAAPDASAVIGERAQILAALRALPRRQREVIVLRYYADLDVDEVAATLRISRGTVRSAAARGLARLAREIGED